MKKYYSVLMMLAMMVVALSFTACGGDDEGIGDSSSLVGTWKIDLLDEISGAFSDEFEEFGYIQFKPDGTCVTVQIIKWKGENAGVFEDEIIVERGTYSVDGNRITARYGNVTDVFTFKMSGNKLTLTTTQGIIITFTYTRVNDSEINKYLK
jgi:hypothetical protein